jgi:uncharacterized membrane protein YgcG
VAVRKRESAFRRTFTEEGDMSVRDRSTHWGLYFLLTAMMGVSGCIPCWGLPSCSSRRSFAIPNTYPLGSTVRSHYHQMEMNGEAADFIIHRHEFVRNTAELNCAGKDHVMEIAARMRSAPFPVLVERSENNSDPELDQLRRNIVTQILLDFGNPDAATRCVVAPDYNKHLNGMEAEPDWYRWIGIRGGGLNNGFGGGGGFGNGFGGGGFGGVAGGTGGGFF